VNASEAERGCQSSVSTYECASNEDAIFARNSGLQRDFRKHGLDQSKPTGTKSRSAVSNSTLYFNRIEQRELVVDTRNHHAPTSLKAMKNKPDPTDASLNETMAARIEIKELGDPVHQKKITDEVEALDGVIETKIEKGALHVSYDPLATTEKKIEQAVRSTGTTIKTAATDTEGAHPDLPTSGENSPTTAER